MPHAALDNRIEEVDLAGSFLPEIVAAHWQGVLQLPNLVTLRLDRSSIRNLNFPPGAQVPRTNELHLAHNALTSLPVLATVFRNLTLLDLSHNPDLASALQGATNPLHGLEQLQSLSLRNTGLTAIPAGFFSSLRALLSLDVAENGLLVVGPTVFPYGDLAQLAFLSAEDNSPSAAIHVAGLAALALARWPHTSCAAGFYQAASQLCVKCPKGSFKPAGPEDQRFCSICVYGQTDDDADAATPCIVCPVGSFTGIGATGPCDDHKCPAGYTDSDLNPATHCLACSEVHQDQGVYAPAGHSGRCTVCPPGTADHDQSAATPCVDCPPGTHTSDGVLGDCALHACAPGTVDDDSNASTPCVACGPGHAVPAGSAGPCTQYVCPAGRHDADSDPTNDCEPCAAGTFKPAGTGPCVACAPGTTDHDNNPATPCLPCNPGSFVPSNAVGRCDEFQCAPGTTDDDVNASTPCMSCTALHGQVGMYASRGNQGLCTLCAAGFADDDRSAATPCVACAPGTFTPQAAQGACALHACAPGTVDDDSNASTPCVACGPGHAVPAGSAGSCTQYVCPAGRHDADSDPTNDCERCSPGTYKPAGTGPCVACAPGTTDYDSDAATPCQACEPGVFVPQEATGLCSAFACAPGTTDNDDDPATPCMDCASLHPGNGTYAPRGNTGACQLCPAGTSDVDLQPATPCESCPAGAHTPGGTRGACELHVCEAGTIDHDGSASTPCQPCPVGTFVPRGQTGLCQQFLCPAGKQDVDFNPATECQLPFILLNGESVACGPRTVPEPGATPRKCVFPYADQVADCKITTSDRGDRVEVKCQTSRVRRRAAPDGLRVVLPAATHLDLSGLHSDVLLQDLLVSTSNTTAPNLVYLSLANNSLQQHHWQQIQQLLQAWAVDSRLILDIIDNPGMPLPWEISLSVQQLQFSADMVPEAAWASDEPVFNASVWTSGQLAAAPPCVSIKWAADTSGGALAVCNASDCTVCPAGTYLSLGQGRGPACLDCPAGAFYQDSPGVLGSRAHCACQQCPRGTYTERAGSTSVGVCRRCPEGTDPLQPAGLRACPCLPGYYRPSDRFGPCVPCGAGVVCSGDTRVLQPGFFWTFVSDAAKTAYRTFVGNMRQETVAAQQQAYNGSQPVPNECPVSSACLGGVDGLCATGYEGIMCATCASGYFDWMQSCYECPRRGLAIMWAVFFAVILSCALIFVMWQNYRVAAGHEEAEEAEEAEEEEERPASRTQRLLDRLNCRMGPIMVVVSYLQVVSSIVVSLTSIQWPRAYRDVLGALQFMTVGLLGVAMPSCLNPDWRLDAYTNFLLGILLPPALLVLLGFVYGIMALRARGRGISNMRAVQTGMLRNVYFVVFLLYPFACSAISKFLERCTPVCTDMDDQVDQCTTYMPSDLSVACNGARYSTYRRIAIAFAVLYAAGVPVAIGVALISAHRHGYIAQEPEAAPKQQASIPPWALALRLFSENYQAQLYWWEVLELLRKLLLTSIIIHIGEGSNLQLAVAAFTSIMAAYLHAKKRPLRNEVDSKLQEVNLLSIVCILVLAILLLRDDTRDDSAVDTEADDTAISVLLICISVAMVVALVVLGVQHCRRRKVEPAKQDVVDDDPPGQQELLPQVDLELQHMDDLQAYQRTHQASGDLSVPDTWWWNDNVDENRQVNNTGYGQLAALQE